MKKHLHHIGCISTLDYVLIRDELFNNPNLGISKTEFEVKLHHDFLQCTKEIHRFTYIKRIPLSAIKALLAIVFLNCAIHF